MAGKNPGLKKGMVLYTAFDEYKIILQIGQGGNGTVYKVADSSGEHFAAKIVDLSELTTKKRKRFKNELNFCESANHKNIIHVIDSGRDPSGNYSFYIMPLYPETLRMRMKHGIEPEDAIELTVSLLKGLGYAHAKRIYHRDIKPENILLESGSNECVIADFGIAHFPQEETITEVRTKEDERMANFQYAAPEQRAFGGTVDGRADVFAVGLILHEMLTGELPLGSDYEKISDKYQDYYFLDDIVELLHKQDPDARLFPANRIIENLFARIEIAKSEKITDEKNKMLIDLQKATDSNIPMKSPEIIDAQVDGGTLVFTLDREITPEWFDVFRSGTYYHKAVMGYEPSGYQMQGDKRLAIQFRAYENELTLKGIVTHLKEWLPTVTLLYNDRVSQQYERRKRDEINRIKSEIEQQNKNRKMNEFVQSLI